MYPGDIDPESGCRLSLPKREELDEADAIVIELGREIFGAKKVSSATLARALQQFGRRARSSIWWH